MGFPNELAQVIINIYNNAKDVLSDKDDNERVVKVSLYIDGENVKISIHDSGGGIPEDILPKIFEPYFTTKHQSQGTGIGLYMSREIIHSHFEGELSVVNKELIHKDKKYFGACFTISIPYIKA
jgi:signal transduction histidine kinase